MNTGLRIPVGALSEGGEPVTLALDLYVPERLAERPVLFWCVPGGGVTRDYYDLRDPAAILERAAGTLDLSEPVALLLVAILHFLPDDDDPHAAVAELMGALAPGSYLVLSHGTPEANPRGVDAADEYTRKAPGTEVTPRPAEEVSRFFDGLVPVDPGLGYITAWRPEGPVPPPDKVGLYGGVARKPS